MFIQEIEISDYVEIITIFVGVYLLINYFTKSLFMLI